MVVDTTGDRFLHKELRQNSCGDFELVFIFTSREAASTYYDKMASPDQYAAIFSERNALRLRAEKAEEERDAKTKDNQTLRHKNYALSNLLNQARAELTAAKARAVEVMSGMAKSIGCVLSWIDNWDTPFVTDEAWPDDRKCIDNSKDSALTLVKEWKIK